MLDSTDDSSKFTRDATLLIGAFVVVAAFSVFAPAMIAESAWDRSKPHAS
jgi:hypothetical protein